MKTVFLSGSRRISRINEAIRNRLDNIVANELSIIVGDANGADKAMQSYLARKEYGHVTVFCAGTRCRNNVGGWSTDNVLVDPKLSGRDFYAQKDKEMARKADFGLIIWDGKSPGSVANMVELLKAGKKVVVYFTPEKSFCNLCNMDDLNMLLDKCDPETIDTISKKIQLKNSLGEIANSQQATWLFDRREAGYDRRRDAGLSRIAGPWGGAPDRLPQPPDRPK